MLADNGSKLKNTKWTLVQIIINGSVYKRDKIPGESIVEFTNNTMKFTSDKGDGTPGEIQFVGNKIKPANDSTNKEYSVQLLGDTLSVSFESKEIKTGQALNITHKYLKK